MKRMKMRGRLVLFDKLDKIGVIFPKDCEITYPEKMPIVHDFKFFEADKVLGSATVSKDEKGFICEADITNSTVIELLDKLNGELPIGGYFRKVKRKGSKIESAELVGISVTFGPALEEYKLVAVKESDKAYAGCKLTDVESHYENGVRVIDKFQFDSVSLVSNPVDYNCRLNLVKESED